MSLLSDIALAIKTKLGGTSTNNTIPRYDGTTCTLKKSNVTISDSNEVTAEGGFVGNLTGTASNATLAASATKLETARTINGVSFNGTANITIADPTKAPLTGGGTSGTWGISITGNASTANNAALAANATKLATARFINGVAFDGTADITVADSTKAPLTGAGATGTWGISVTGNSATTTKLATARSINGVAFDGTANIAIAFANLASKPTTLSGYGITDLTSHKGDNPIDTANTTVNAIGYASSFHMFGAIDGGLINTAYSPEWQSQIGQDFRTGQIALRGKNNGTWTGWRTVLDSENYNSYSPSKTGTGASGTWGINITGNAATATTATNQTAGSGITCDAKFKNTPAHGTSFSECSGQTDAPNTGWWLIYSIRHSNASNYWGTQIAYGWEDNANAIYQRNISGGTWSGWTRVDVSGANITEIINNAGYITSAGRAYPRLSNGGDLNFHWSGQGGQPTWLWGGSDGANMYVYNPSNFSVNYANSAGSVSASAVASGTAGIAYTAVGSYVFARTVNTNVEPNATTPGSNLRAAGMTASSGSANITVVNTALPGTWRAMGVGYYTSGYESPTISGATLWLRIA